MMTARILIGVSLVVALMWAGWMINGWRLEAARAEGLDLQLAVTIAARDKADADRARLGGELEVALANVRTVVKTVERRIKVYVPRNSACDFGPDVVGLLNEARGYEDSGTAKPGEVTE